MINQIQAFLIQLLAATIPLIIGLLIVWRAKDKFVQDVLNDVAGDFSNRLTEAFTEPNVKKAFSIIGSQGGKVKTDEALRTKVSEKVMNEFPGLKMVLEKWDITAMEGLQLMNDPIFGPLIQGVMQFAQKGVGDLTKSLNIQGLNMGPGRPSHNPSGEMS